MFGIDDIIGAIVSANAASAQEKAARDAMGLQREMWEQGRADQMPWLDAGKSSLGDLLKMLSPGYDTSQLASDPGFQFRMQEGQKALERSAAARGGLNSGRMLKDLTRFSQGVASDEYGNRFNRLSTLAGFGQNAGQSLGGLGRGFADSMSGLYGAVGNAQAAGHIGVGNAIGGGFKERGKTLMSLLGGGMPIPTQGGGY